MKAYNEATQTVALARQTQQKEQNLFVELLGGNTVKIGLTITDVSTGVAGATIGATEKYRAAARTYTAESVKYAKLAGDTSLSPSDNARALMNKSFYKVKAQMASEAATGTPLRRLLDKLPEKIKINAEPNLGFIKLGGRVGRLATGVLKRVPVIGLGVTAIGVGMDISEGKPADQAIASGASSLATGAVIGACVGGPVGVLAGAAIGAGVGYVVDHHWGDIKHGVGDAADWAGDKLSGVGHAIGDLF